MGVPVTGTIQTTDPTTDTYATIDPIEGIDGLRSVVNTSVRNAIPTLRRRQGMVVVIQTDNTAWQLKASPWAFDDTDWTAFGTGGSNTNGTVTSVGVNTANGFSGTTTNNTTNARITLATSVNGILLGNGTAVSALGIGTGLSLNSGTLSGTASNTNGTVTSVGVNTANGFAGTVANNTTNAGISISTSVNGIMLGNGTAASALGIGSGLSLNAGTLNTVAASAGSSIGGVVTVPISAAFGGTGLATLTAHGVLVGEGNANVNSAVPGTTGYPLISQGNSTDPAFASTGIAIDSHYGTIGTGTINSNTATLNLAVNDWWSVALTNTANTAIAVANATVGQQFSLILLQNNAGTNLVSWFNTILWPGGTTPTLTTGANKRDVFTFKCINTNSYLGFVASQNS